MNLYYDNNEIIENSINYNHRGIYLSECVNTNVAYNELYCNDICIIENDCIGTILQNNNCVECLIPGFNIFMLF